VTNTGDIAANSVTPALGLVGGAAVGISAPATNLAPGATAMVTLTFSSSAGKSGSAQPLFVLGFANGTEPNGTPPKDEGFWVKRAREQVNLTYYRLVFRQFFYTGPPNRGALPLPPRAIWHFDLALCEGQTLGANNQPVDPTNLSALVFDPTSLVDALGNPISRIRCNFSPNYAANNVGHVSVSQEQGSSFVNDPCDRGQAGPLRDCGFTPPTKIYSCPAGSKVQLHCKTGGSKQVLRACEVGQMLGKGSPCTYLNSASNSIIDGDSETVTFSCPAVRDATVAGAGGYSLSNAPLLPLGATEAVACREN
jgi:hypothetical protein